MTEYGPGGASARFDVTKRHRYTLHRNIGIHTHPPNKRAVWVMLNPSTADAFRLDPTIKRCVKFSELWGYDQIDVVNLFSLRSPYPTDLYDVAASAYVAPIPPLREVAARLGCDFANDEAILETCKGADIVIAAWGNHGHAKGLELAGVPRADAVCALLELAGVSLWHLGQTKEGAPVHPLARGKLFVPYDRKLTRYYTKAAA